MGKLYENLYIRRRIVEKKKRKTKQRGKMKKKVGGGASDLSKVKPYSVLHKSFLLEERIRK